MRNNEVCSLWMAAVAQHNSILFLIREAYIPATLGIYDYISNCTKR